MIIAIIMVVFLVLLTMGMPVNFALGLLGIVALYTQRKKHLRTQSPAVSIFSGRSLPAQLFGKRS